MAFSDPRDRIVAAVPDWESYTPPPGKYDRVLVNRQEMVRELVSLTIKKDAKDWGSRPEDYSPRMRQLTQMIQALTNELKSIRRLGTEDEF